MTYMKGMIYCFNKKGGLSSFNLVLLDSVGSDLNAYLLNWVWGRFVSTI